VTAQYRRQVASDLIRDGLGVELIDQRGDVLAEIFRCDADHTLVLEVFHADIPSPEIDALILDAYERLERFEDGTPLPPRELMGRFHRDSSGALLFSVDAPPERYGALVAAVAATLGLRSVDSPTRGVDIALKDFESGEGRVSFQWGYGTAFTVRAAASQSEDLVRKAARLCGTKMPPHS